MPPGLGDEYNPPRKLMYPGGVGLRKLCMISVRRTDRTRRYVRAPDTRTVEQGYNGRTRGPTQRTLKSAFGTLHMLGSLYGQFGGSADGQSVGRRCSVVPDV